MNIKNVKKSRKHKNGGGMMKRKKYDNLLNWKQNHIKMPYMLMGARQTGKTYILTEFCKNEFQNYLYLNLENRETIREVFEQTLVPEEIIQNIEAILNVNIEVENTILFLDEIQVSERAIHSLKYFAESEKNYKIVCAGSLLGVKINRFKSSFPVGKVWMDYLYPLDFEEFLMAIGENKLLTLIAQSYQEMKPMLEPTHQKALKLYYEYLCIGGMPSVVNNYLQNEKQINKVEDEILNMIVLSYLADMAKYTQNTESIKNNKIYQSIPAQLGKENKKFKYSLVEPSARSREYETSLEWLISSNMVIKCNNIKVPQSPLKAYQDDSFKVYLSDIGLLRVLANLSKNEIILNKNMLYKGVMAENYVAQILYSKNKELYYWQVSNQYEVDFVINLEGDIIPIEVKASDNVTSKSLNQYIKRYQPKYAIRISTKNFGFENQIKSIPLYASHLIGGNKCKD